MTFFKPIMDFDVSSLVKQIDSHPELWDQHTARKVAPGSPHSRMSDIWVRYNDVASYAASGDYSGFNDAHTPIWYPAWDALPALHPIVFGIMAETDAELLGGVLITRIPGGQGIAPHADRGWHPEFYRDKFYVALKSPPGARFHCDTEFLEPAVGSVHRFDNTRTHWVTNDSQEDRMTLIVCIRTDKYRGEP